MVETRFRCVSECLESVCVVLKVTKSRILPSVVEHVCKCTELSPLCVSTSSGSIVYKVTGAHNVNVFCIVLYIGC